MFKVFILLRLPISVVCLLGYAAALSGFGALVTLGACAFLGVASVKLARLQPGALQIAGWLLALESLGAVMLGTAGSQVAAGRLDPVAALTWSGIVLAAWTAPNAFAFYKARGKFAESKS
jgi:hypothetical protein